MSDSLAALFAGNTGNGKPPSDDLDALFGLPDPSPLPAGWYACEFVRGGLGQSNSGKQRYELRAKLTEGEHVGKLVFDDLYLTAAAWWKSKPILGKLGIDNPEKLRRDLPPGLIGRVRLVIEDRDGIRRNKVCDLELTGRKPTDVAAPIGAPPVDPFAPAPSTAATRPAKQSEEGSPPTDAKADGWVHPLDRHLPADQLSFSFGANADGPYGGDRP